MKTIRVWDLPTRLFHGALVLCGVGLVITAEVADQAMEWHFRFGYATLTLLLFRLVWGVVGGHWSRFRTFIVGPRTLLQYLSRYRVESPTVGHNPLGALSVVAMLGVALLQVLSGLMSDDQILAAGPLVNQVPAAWVECASHFHTEIGKPLLLLLVLLHVSAIAWYRIKKNKDLIAPMLWGDAPAPLNAPSAEDNLRTRLLALAIVLAAAAAVAALLRWAQ